MSSKPISERALLNDNGDKNLYVGTGITHAVLDVMLSLTDPTGDASVEIGIKEGNNTTWLIKNILLDEIESVKTVEKLVVSAGQAVVVKRTSGNRDVSVLASGIEEQNPVVYTQATGLVGEGTITSGNAAIGLIAPSPSAIEYVNTMVTVYNTDTSTPALVRIFNTSSPNPIDSMASVVVSVDPRDTLIVNNIIVKPGNYLSIKSTGATIEWGVIGVAITPQP